MRKRTLLSSRGLWPRTIFVLFALGCAPQSASFTNDSSRAGLARQLAPWLDSPYRFTGFPPTKRSPASSRADLPAARALLEALSSAAERENGDEARARLGIARVAFGRFDEGLEALELALEEASNDAGRRNDVAVGLLARGHARGAADDLLAALDLLARRPRTPEAECNLQHLLAELSLVHAAARTNCEGTVEDVPTRLDPLPKLPDLPSKQEVDDLEAETTRGAPIDDLIAAGPERWRFLLFERLLLDIVSTGDSVASPRRQAELIAGALERRSGDPDARRVLQELPARPESALLNALTSFAAGSEALRRYELDKATSALAEAARTLRADLPTLADWAEVGFATTIYYRHDLNAADALLGRIGKEAALAGRKLLRARSLWLRANVALESGFQERAADYAAEASKIYSAAGERRNEAAVRSILATALDNLGATREASNERLRSLRLAFDSGYGARFPVVLSSLARSQAQAHRLAAATLLQEEAVAYDREDGLPLGIAESSAELAQYRARAGEIPAAAELIVESRRAAASLQSPDQKRRILARTDLVEAEYLCETSPTVVFARLDRLLGEWRRQGYRFLAPETRLLTARCKSHLGMIGPARADFRAALDEMAGQAGAMATSRNRLLWMELARQALDELMDLDLKNGRRSEAFEALDRLRVAAAPGGARAPAEIVGSEPRDSLRPNGVCLLQYLALPDRLEIELSCHRRPTLAATVGVPKQRLDREIDGTVARLREERGPWRADPVRRLSEWLVAPVIQGLEDANRLVVVGDGPIDRVPFAALQDLRTGKALGRSVSIEVSPSVSIARSISAAGRRRLRPGEIPILVLASPDRSEASDGLPLLPGALEEARRIGELVPSARLLTGRLATRAAFLARAPNNEILHIATHTQPDLLDPLRSRILTATDPAGDSITTADLVSLRLDRCRLAVLSSCESGRGYESRLSGSIALSRGFLAAGIPQVVSTAWSIDDRTAVTFSELFYDALNRQRDVAVALETAQRRAADSTDSALAAVRTWAAYQLTAAGGAAEVK